MMIFTYKKKKRLAPLAKCQVTSVTIKWIWDAEDPPTVAVTFSEYGDDGHVHAERTVRARADELPGVNLTALGFDELIQAVLRKGRVDV